MKTTRNIAILFFSRSADHEALAKNWTRNKSHLLNKKIANLLIENTEKALSKSGLPIYRYHEDLQTANSFGENISLAFAKLFEMGFSSVIAVGNDHTNVQNIDWKFITETLRSGKSVLGASMRGGTYLIGLQKDSFHNESFAQLPWQTNKLFNALCQTVTKKSDLTLLSPERDLNTFYDVIKYLKEANKNKQFVKMLFQFLYELTGAYAELVILFKTLLTGSYHSLRAPPLAY